MVSLVHTEECLRLAQSDELNMFPAPRSLLGREKEGPLRVSGSTKVSPDSWG